MPSYRRSANSSKLLLGTKNLHFQILQRFCLTQASIGRFASSAHQPRSASGWGSCWLAQWLSFLWVDAASLCPVTLCLSPADMHFPTSSLISQHPPSLQSFPTLPDFILRILTEKQLAFLEKRKFIPNVPIKRSLNTRRRLCGTLPPIHFWRSR